MKNKSKKIELLNDFTAEKTNDVFKSVVFRYNGKNWKGAIPKYLEKQGIIFTDTEIAIKAKEFYKELNPKNRSKWILESNKKWSSKQKAGQTYKVLKALHSGKWECRVHGPVPKVNPQPAARLGALKKVGYIFGSQRKLCSVCNKTTMHDILIMLPPFETRFAHGNELRSPLSNKLKERIKSVLGFTESCFNIKRSSKELIIDHKFPSQRWTKVEPKNPDNMSDFQIRKKFQLLSNQTNMWKSRYCDTCVKKKQRGEFMGLKWYYKGGENWTAKSKDDERGCVGCPWYDMEKWKSEVIKKLSRR